MKETIISWIVTAVFMMLTFLWGYRTGKAETLDEELLKIIRDQVTAQNAFINMFMADWKLRKTE